MKLPRDQKPKKVFSVRLSAELIEALRKEEMRTGETFTQIIERLLKQGLKV